MNTTIQCIILLACTAICTSASIKGCRCVKTNKTVKVSLIANVTVIDPRPYCNKQEVIVTLKDNSLKCLDPKERFTKLVLQSIQKRSAAKMNTTRSKTTTAPATASVTASVVPTSS